MNTFIFSVFALAATLTAAPKRVVCFGDSTTAPRTNVVTYCEQLAREFPADRVVFLNRGVPGNTTADARKRFDKDVVQAAPDLVFILFGLNDSSVDIWKKPPATAPRVSLADFSVNLSWFVQSLRSRNIEVILVTFNPITWSAKTLELYGGHPYDPKSPDGFNLGRGEYLEAIRSLAGTLRVPLLDVNAAYKSYAAAPPHSINDLLLDGMHPNTSGQAITAKLARPVIVKLVSSKSHAN